MAAQAPRTGDGQKVLADFAKRFEVWLLRKKHNPVSYAEETGIDLSEISKVMKGKRNPSLIVASKMIAGFGITLSEFYSDRELSELERRFSDEVRLFKDALAVADKEAMSDIRKALARAIRETTDRRADRPNVSKAM